MAGIRRQYKLEDISHTRKRKMCKIGGVQKLCFRCVKYYCAGVVKGMMDLDWHTYDLYCALIISGWTSMCLYSLLLTRIYMYRASVYDKINNCYPKEN